MNEDPGTTNAPYPPSPLLRTGALELKLATRYAPQLRIWALGMDGERKERIPGRVCGSTIEITLDTKTLEGATPSFELAVE